MARQKTNPNDPFQADFDENVEPGEDGPDEPSLKQVNPNTPMSQIDQRRALEATVDASSTKTLRDRMTNDPEELKNQLVVALERQDKADSEIADMRRALSQSQSKVDGYDRMQGQLNQELKLTECRWRPLVGYYIEEHSIDCVAAPLGTAGRPGQAAFLFLHEGKPLSVAVTTEKVVLANDGKGRWMLK